MATNWSFLLFWITHSGKVSRFSFILKQTSILNIFTAGFFPPKLSQGIDLVKRYNEN